MGERPYFKFYTGDFIRDTMDFSAEQVGAYTLLLIHMWSSGGWVSKDDQKLARVTKMSVKKWKAVGGDILNKCVEKDDLIGNRRMLDELKKVHGQSESRASAGAEGGRAKAAKNSQTGLASATENTKQNTPYARSTHSHSQKEIPQEPTVLSVQRKVEDDLEIPESLDRRKKRGTRLPEDFKPQPLPMSFAQNLKLEPAAIETIIPTEFENFTDYWKSKTGQNATKLDWDAAWRIWLRKACESKLQGRRKIHIKGEDPLLAAVRQRI